MTSTLEQRTLSVGLVPTAILVLVLGAAAQLIGPLINGINAVVVALVLGLLVVNVGGDRISLDDQVPTFLLKRALKFAVILLGAGIDLASIADVGLKAVGITAIAVVMAMAISWYLGRALGLVNRSALLIGIGTAICGASAIAAVAPVLKAKKEEVGLALATVFSFNAIALLAYPLIGAALGLSQVEFGSWAGIGVHDTASAVATGFAFGAEAGEFATLVKLERTLFLLPLLAIAVAMVQREDGGDVSRGSTLRKNIPWFIVGFVVLATANTFGWLGEVGGFLNDAAKLIIVFVVVAVGLTLRLSKVASIGKPLFYTGFAASLAVGAFALAAIVGLGVG
ncbi:MAG: putative sulfate exporter family transporter [Acidimicrobiia bacterium]|nr:putative sulfate exporter family transporter [Acidimicrobiia bacterium]